jgi:predicted RNA-binding protein with PUA-like domain
MGTPIMPCWLMKSEPDEFSIDDLAAAPARTTAWFGVRNYQARNFMLKEMQVGDPVFFYHSSCPEPGIAGIAEVSSAAYPDASQFDRKSPYFDPGAKRESPRWFNVDVRFVRKTRLVSLDELRSHRELSKMRTLARGNRLSITPVSEAEWDFITQRLMKV